ncbi:hypothetical protein ACIOWI_37780 [Streptomyces sp. NPDC087659]|uniref:hypothetical protein n=1 Tax=Streptomyces sp. NPDC087659 TaxID=3365801 RepID=UPI00382541AD
MTPPTARTWSRRGHTPIVRVRGRSQRRISIAALACYPPYAPQLNPVEGIWSLLRRRCQANTAFTDPTHLMRVLRQGLRQVQYRPDLIDGCLAGTGLTLTTSRLEGQ